MPDRIKQLEKRILSGKANTLISRRVTPSPCTTITRATRTHPAVPGRDGTAKGSGSTATFTVRKMSNNVGRRAHLPIASPFIEQIEVNKRGSVRRARIFYLRKLRGKSTRITRSARTSRARTAPAPRHRQQKPPSEVAPMHPLKRKAPFSWAFSFTCRSGTSIPSTTPPFSSPCQRPRSAQCGRSRLAASSSFSTGMLW